MPTKNDFVDLITKLVDRQYQFCKFSREINPVKLKQLVFLRHDIDFSLELALEMAEIEAKLGIHSTYFVQLKSPLYNAISKIGLEILKQISSYGHDVSPHLELSSFDQFPTQFLTQLEFYKQLVANCNTNIISFHRFGKRVKEYVDFKLPSNIEHTYQRKYFTDIDYLSDSGGDWERLVRGVAKGIVKYHSFQLVIHPMWWLVSGSSPIETLDNFVIATRKRYIDYLENTAVSYSLEHLRSRYDKDVSG
jgi:hypothetical protein